MKNQGLIFIPDISGFTRFVTETEIDHSRLIIQELLEILINANNLGLEVSEIEGDAILFYKFGDRPELAEVYSQVEKMFLEFHRNLIAYEHRRYCQCKACMSAIKLTLKVITHYGEFTEYRVRNFNKLIGKGIIVAHQLLKNDIPQHEYWLITESLTSASKANEFVPGMTWNLSSKNTETGDIVFQYTPLSGLRHKIPPPAQPQVDLDKMSKMLSISREYPTDIITLFHATGDFKYRHRWQHGVTAVEELTHYLPRVGMKCRFITDRGPIIVHAVDYHYQDDKIQFSETDESRQTCTRYTLTRTGIKRTTLRLEYYVNKDFLSTLAFKMLRRKKLESAFKKSTEKLEPLVRELKIPSALDA